MSIIRSALAVLFTMSAWSISSASAQTPEIGKALEDALQASADLAHASMNSKDPALASAASKAKQSLTTAVAALKAAPLCRPPPVIDSMTFDLLVESLRKGNRSETLPVSMISPTIERHLLSVAQLKTLLELITRASDRLDMVRLANRRIVDPENAAVLYGLFPVKNDQRALALILSQ